MDFKGFFAKKRFSLLSNRLPGGTRAYISLKWIILSNGTRLLDNCMYIHVYIYCNIVYYIPKAVDLFRINKIQVSLLTQG